RRSRAALMGAGRVRTINSGSATLKIGIYETGATGATGGDPRQLWRVKIDRLGSDAAELQARSPNGEQARRELGPRSNAAEALDDFLRFLDEVAPDMRFDVVSHRVVHGGPDLHEPVAIGHAELEILRGLSSLAPLHQPHNIAGIEAAGAAFPDALQVAC